MIVKANQNSRKYNIKIKELNRVANNGEEFNIPESRYEELRGHNKYRINLINEVKEMEINRNYMMNEEPAREYHFFDEAVEAKVKEEKVVEEVTAEKEVAEKPKKTTKKTVEVKVEEKPVVEEAVEEAPVVKKTTRKKKTPEEKSNE